MMRLATMRNVLIFHDDLAANSPTGSRDGLHHPSHITMAKAELILGWNMP